MFRDGDMGLEETITKMKVEASQANADNWQAKQDAMRAIGGNLNKLRQAMARQRAYDLSTVKSITDTIYKMQIHVNGSHRYASTQPFTIGEDGKKRYTHKH